MNDNSSSSSSNNNNRSSSINFNPLSKIQSKIFIFENSTILKERKRKFRKSFIF